MTLADHHSTSESFIKHMGKEVSEWCRGLSKIYVSRLRRSCTDKFKESGERQFYQILRDLDTEQFVHTLFVTANVTNTCSRIKRSIYLNKKLN